MYLLNESLCGDVRVCFKISADLKLSPHPNIPDIHPPFPSPSLPNLKPQYSSYRLESTAFLELFIYQKVFCSRELLVCTCYVRVR